jgi:hypothetical protein
VLPESLDREPAAAAGSPARKLDIHGLERVDVREQHPATPLRQFHTHLGEDRARLDEVPSIARAPARYARRNWSRPDASSCSSSHASSSPTGVVPKKRDAAPRPNVLGGR